MDEIRIIQVGLGSIGKEIAKLAMEKGFKIIGAVDINPELVGKDLGEVLGKEETGVKISDSLKETLSKEADIVVNSSISWLEKLEPQITESVKAGKNFISTCEELVYPFPRYPEIAERIDRLAKENNVSVLGTGVNPGFVMDRLVLALAQNCKKINEIRVLRSGDASKRRLPFQKKVGIGMNLEEFKERLKRTGFGHVGLFESLRMVSDALDMKLDEIKEDIEPVCDGERVLGIKQTASGMIENKPVISLEFQMYAGAENKDVINIAGDPPINLEIKNGIQGDTATAAIIVNSISNVAKARSGLLTVKDFV